MKKYIIVLLLITSLLAGCDTEEVPKPSVDELPKRSMEELYEETFSVELEEYDLVYQNGDITIYKIQTNTNTDTLYSYKNINFNVNGESFYDLGYFSYNGEEVLTIEDLDIKYNILYELVINVFLQDEIVIYDFNIEDSRCVYTEPTIENPDMWSNSNAIIRIYYNYYSPIVENFEFSKEEEYLMSLFDKDTVCHHNLWDEGAYFSENYFIRIDIEGHNRIARADDIIELIKMILKNNLVLDPKQELIDNGNLYSPEFVHGGSVGGYDIVRVRGVYNIDTKFTSYYIDDTYAFTTSTTCRDSEQIYSCNGFQAYKNNERFYLIDIIDEFSTEEYMKFLDLIHANRYQ